MACLAQADKILRVEDAQCIGTILLNTPAELLLHHKAVKQYRLWLKPTDERIEAAVVQRDVSAVNALTRQVGHVLRMACRAGKGDVPAAAAEQVQQ